MADTIDPITALERAYDDLAKVVADLRPDQLTPPDQLPRRGTCGRCSTTSSAAR